MYTCLKAQKVSIVKTKVFVEGRYIENFYATMYGGGVNLTMSLF